MRPILIVLSILVFACSGRRDESVAGVQDTLQSTGSFNSYLPETYTNLQNYLAKPGEAAITITKPVVLLVNPTLEQIDSLEKEFGEDFYTIADDAAYYMSNANSLIDSLQIPTENATGRYYKFVGRTNSWTLDLRKPGAPEWNILFFHPDSVPVICIPIDVNREKLEKYFHSERQ